MSQQINLYDPALERRRDWLALHFVAGAVMLLAVAVGGSGYLARLPLSELARQAAANEAQLKAARDQIAAFGQQAAARKPDSRLEQELAAKRLLLGTRGEILATLRRSVGPEARSFADYLRGFARQTVSGLWLTGFAIDATSGTMEITGRTVDPALLPEYIRRLNREAAFAGQSFAALKLDAGKTESATGAAAAARMPYHEFTLIPAKADAAEGAAKLTQTVAASGGGRG